MPRWFKWALGAAIVAPPLVMARQGWRAARMEAAAFDPPRGPVARPESLEGLDGMRDARFGAPAVAGWWVPARNGAAVALLHGSYGNRASLLVEARALGRAGFGVLLVDWPGHGESEGRVTLGRAEIDALRAAVDFIAAQPGVEKGRIGALGASVGAALVVRAAPGDPRLRALALVGVFTDSDDQTRYAFKRPWAYVPALWVDHEKMEAPLRPIDAVPALRDRALFFLAGEKDDVVPPEMARALHAAAPTADKELWLVPGAGHSHLEESAGGAYERRIVAFFERALSARG